MLVRLKQAHEEGKLNTFYLVIFCILISFLFLTIFSANSFLYEMNPWTDENWFITMANGILSGKVPYKDLYEQKGPLIFFLFTFATIFKNAYFGVFLIELLFFTLFMICTYKLARKFLKVGLSLISMILLLILIGSSQFYYYGGGSVEEFSLPIIMWLMLKVYEYIVEKKTLTKKASFIIGILISVIFWSKYSILILPALFLLTYLISSLLRKEYKQLLTNVSIMFAGFMIVSILVIFIFWGLSALSDLFQAYFYDNLIRYKVIANNSLLSFIKSNLVHFILCGLSIVLVLLKYRLKGIIYCTIYLIYILSFTIMGFLFYYFLPMVIFEYIFIVLFFERIFNLKIIKKTARFIKSIVLLFCVVFVFLFSFSLSSSIKLLNYDRDDYMQLLIADDIKSLDLDSPTLLCYKMYDHGFYAISNIVPEEKFYALNNFTIEQYPELYESFDKAVSEGHSDLLIVFYDDYIENQELFDKQYNIYKIYDNKTYNNFPETILMYRNNLVIK